MRSYTIEIWRARDGDPVLRYRWFLLWDDRRVRREDASDDWPGQPDILGVGDGNWGYSVTRWGARRLGRRQARKETRYAGRRTPAKPAQITTGEVSSTRCLEA